MFVRRKLLHPHMLWPPEPPNEILCRSAKQNLFMALKKCNKYAEGFEILCKQNNTKSTACTKALQFAASPPNGVFLWLTGTKIGFSFLWHCSARTVKREVEQEVPLFQRPLSSPQRLIQLTGCSSVLRRLVYHLLLPHRDQVVERVLGDACSEIKTVFSLGHTTYWSVLLIWLWYKC